MTSTSASAIRLADPRRRPRRGFGVYGGGIRCHVVARAPRRSNRSDTTACAITPGSNPVRFPYLDQVETRHFDLDSGALYARVLEVNADNSTCDAGWATASGFDAYGNLTAKTVQRFDSAGSTDGYRAYVARHCERARNTYTANASTWWLDRLDQSVRTTQISYASGHALPSGASAPEQTQVTTYTWNSNRTLASETLQPGVANQQRVSTYAYPASASNYGLPSSVTVAASGDSAGNRVTSTTYTADGYFPASVTNALGHTASTTVRARDGQPTLVTDANGLRTLSSYDAFGFATRIQFRGKADAEYLAPDKQAALAWCDAQGCASAAGAGCAGAAAARHRPVHCSSPTSGPTAPAHADATAQSGPQSQQRDPTPCKNRSSTSWSRLRARPAT